MQALAGCPGLDTLPCEPGSLEAAGLAEAQGKRGYAALARLRAVPGNGIGPSLPRKVGTQPFSEALKVRRGLKLI